MKSHTVHFDTLEYKNDLVEAGMSEMEAEALTKANAKVFNHILDHNGEITKGDFREAEINIRSDVNERIHGINLKIEELRYELKEDIHALDLKVEENLHKIDLKIEETKRDLSLKTEETKRDLSLKTEQTKHDLSLKIEEIRSELTIKIEQTKSDLIKYTNDCTWKVIALLGGIIIIATTTATLAQHFWK